MCSVKVMEGSKTLVEKTGFIIFGSTGCTCCRDQNFIEGIIDEEEYARLRAGDHAASATLSSQFSKTGSYIVRKIDYELITDGRIIIGEHVLSHENFRESGTVANALRSVGEEICQFGEYNKI